MSNRFKVLAVVTASLCALALPALASADYSETIHAVLHDANGKNVGMMSVHQLKKGVLFNVTVHGLKPGVHGIHIHSIGKCEGPDFKSSGGHLALTGQEHGFKNPKGPHLGDLPNLTVKADGTGRLHYLNKRVTLGVGSNSLRKVGGTALVIHAGPDDEMSNPAGNAGGRVACAVIAQ